jgi:energy-coupling factor transporter ATP-binding protein EcfA2
VRSAEINGRLQTLRRRAPEKGPRLTSLKIEKLSGFHDLDVSLDNSFLAICGGTGTGKSTLLLSVYAALKGIDSESEEFRKGRVANFRARVAIGGEPFRYEEDRDFSIGGLASDGYTFKVFLDTIDDRTDVSRRAAVGDVDALKEGIEPFELDPDALSFLKMICRKEYSSVKVYEIGISGDRYYPHFEVVEGAVSYNGEDMGSGEHSAFYLAWRLSTAPPGSVVLLEEPEALLPPASHDQMCAMISTFAQKRNLLPVFTTHSSGIVEFLADGDVISLSRIDGRTMIPSSTEAKAQVLAKLGLLARKPIIGLVEDAVGRAVVEEVLELFGFSEVLDASLVTVSEGAGGIKTLLEMLASEQVASGVFGFLDGDMETEAKKWRSKDRLLFLPLTKSPEIEMLAALEANPKEFAVSANRAEGRVVRELERSAGKDHHDRFVAVADALGLELPVFTKLSFNHYIRVTKSEERLRALAADLAKRTGVVPPDLA